MQHNPTGPRIVAWLMTAMAAVVVISAFWTRDWQAAAWAFNTAMFAGLWADEYDKRSNK